METTKMAIGFTSKYYTLWTVEVRKEYDRQGSYYYKTLFTYHQNLSMELEVAQEKAKEFGCVDLEPDHDLYGRNRSFSIESKKTVEEIPTEEQLLGRIFWNNRDYDLESRRAALTKAIELGYYKVFEENGKKFFVENEEGYKEIIDLFINNTYKIHNTVISERNKQSFMLDGVKYFFESVKEMYYNGYKYELPMDSKGKAKRIKGKNVKLIDFVVDYSGGYNSSTVDTREQMLDNDSNHILDDYYFIKYPNSPTVLIKDFEVLK